MDERSYPRILQGWDVEEDAPLEDVITELEAMHGLPVDVELSSLDHPDQPRVEFRGILDLPDVEASWLEVRVKSLGSSHLVFAAETFAKRGVRPTSSSCGFPTTGSQWVE